MEMLAQLILAILNPENVFIKRKVVTMVTPALLIAATKTTEDVSTSKRIVMMKILAPKISAEKENASTKILFLF
jgi:hypothetical protein